MQKALLAFGLLLAMSACNTQQQELKKLEDRDEELSRDFFKNGTDTTAINGLITSFHDYVRQYPTDTSSARLLFRMGDLFRIKNQSTSSLECYNQVYLQYPTSSLHPLSLFMMGFVCENDLHDLSEAAKHYTLFLRKYPQHSLARDAQFALDNLGKTPQQLLDELQQKNIDTTDSI